MLLSLADHSDDSASARFLATSFSRVCFARRAKVCPRTPDPRAGITRGAAFCHAEPQAKDQRAAIFQTDTPLDPSTPMHAAKVHELKDNPSEALRAAKKSPVIVMKATTPRP
jgi:hypothetical protein